MTDELRIRNCYPSCSSLNIGKTKKHGAYRCKSCGAVFQNAKLKEVKTHNKIPEHLRKIIEKKQKEALVGDVELVGGKRLILRNLNDYTPAA